MLRLIWAQQQKGNFWSLEQPRGSRMWDVPEVVELLKLEDVKRVDFDRCMYDLKPSDDDDENAMVKKPTTFMTNIPYPENSTLLR